MSKDLFKEFVAENRGDFESHQPDYEPMWKEIRQGIERKAPRRRIWLAAAAALLIGISAVGLLYQLPPKSPAELVEAEIHYHPLIAAKMQIIQTHHQEIDEAVWLDLQILDEAFDELKRDLKEQAHSEEVMRAIIENYRIKLDMLDQILNQIEAKEDEKQQEPVDA